MTTATIRIKTIETVTTRTTTRPATGEYFYKDGDTGPCSIKPGETVEIDAADLAAHTDTGMVEEVTE